MSDGDVQVTVVSPGVVQFNANGVPFVGPAGGGGGTGAAGIIGSGSPAGVVIAPPGTMYKDTTKLGGGLWIKVTGSDANGWENLIA